MNFQTNQELDENFYMKIRYISKLKTYINLRLFLMKIIYILLLYYFFYIQTYTYLLGLFPKVSVLLHPIIFANAFLNYFNKFYLIFFEIFVLIYLFIFFFHLWRILKGVCPLNSFIFAEILLIQLTSVIQVQLLILNFIGLLILYKLAELINKFQKNYDNYKDYKEKYRELESLKNVIDTTLIIYTITTLVLIIVAYSILQIFQQTNIQINPVITIGIPIILIPIITYLILYSTDIFKDFKKTSKEKSDIKI